MKVEGKLRTMLESASQKLWHTSFDNAYDIVEKMVNDKKKMKEQQKALKEK